MERSVLPRTLFNKTRESRFASQCARHEAPLVLNVQSWFLCNLAASAPSLSFLRKVHKQPICLSVLGQSYCCLSKFEVSCPLAERATVRQCREIPFGAPFHA